MKTYLLLTLILCLIMTIFPLFSTLEKTNDDIQAENTDKTSSVSENEINIIRTDSGKISSVSVSDYLIGVLAAEMPVSFSSEALKAQAVASYTYAKYLTENQSDNTPITDSSDLHQKYIDIDEQKEKWQSDFEKNRAKLEAVVNSVAGQYLSFEGKTAMTVFHALSNGKTLAADDVWNEAVPYLISVNAPGDVLAEEYEIITTISSDDFREIFTSEGISFENDDATKWAKVKNKSNDGFIKSLEIGGVVFSSRQLRKLLSLPGESFTASVEDNEFIFKTYGKGHGVGMSQNSADYMARQGKNYKEILSHFYPGTTLLYQ